jgi:hypothetical protein
MLSSHFQPEYVCGGGIEPRALNILGKCSTTELQPNPSLSFEKLMTVTFIVCNEQISLLYS